MATTTWPAEVYVFDGTRWVSISPHGMTSLPPATGTTLGAVIVGSGVNVAPDGTISVTHFSGDYNDLINKPIVAAPVQSDWNSAGGDSYILNKPVALSQFSNDLKISDFPNDALYATVPQAAAAAPVQSIAAGANVAISDDGHGHITIASTGTGSGPGGGITSVSGSAPIKVVGGTSAPVISLNVGAGLKVNAGALEADVPDASTTTKGIIQIADAASITAGTALRAVDAAGLKAVTDQQTKDFVNVSGDTMTGTLVIPDGTAAAPSLKFDDATGLFQPAANAWAISTAGAERVRVDSAGNVGIGRTAPASALDVNGVVTVSAGAEAAPALVASGDSGSGVWFPGADTVAISTSGLWRLRCQGATAELRDKKMFFNIYTTVPAGAGTAFPSEAIKLNDTHGTTLSKNWLYQVNLTTKATANRTGSRYLVYWDEASKTWVARVVGVSAAASFTNTPRLLVYNTNSNIKAYNDHPGIAYATFVTVEATHKGQAQGSAHPAGSDFHWQRDGDELFYTDGNVGIGNTDPASALDVNGVITVSAGTAASPSVCASGDGDSGLWFPAANAVSLSTSGLERLRVDSIGRVGIGTNPSYVLHVNGAIATTTGDVYVLGGGVRVTRSSNPFILFTEGAAGVGQIRASSSQLRMTDAAGTSVFFALDTGSGSLGLGTTTPASRLDVNGVITVAAGTAAAPAIVCGKGASNSGIFWPATNAVAISTVGSERLRVKSTGGVKYVPLATAPATPEEGEVYFDSTTKKLRVYDGTAWADLH